MNTYVWVCAASSWHIQHHPPSVPYVKHVPTDMSLLSDAWVQSAFARFWFWTNQHYLESLCCPYSRLATCNQLKITPYSLFCHFTPCSAPLHFPNQIVWPGWNLIKTETSCWGLPSARADLYVKCQQTASRLWRQESIINIWLSAFKAKGRQRHWL